MIERFGKYIVERELCHGGFGEVYLATDPDVGQKVAIKRLRAGGDRGLLNRFRDEIRLTARLRHKNIVIIHASDEQDGDPYLVMEYLEGRTLRAVIQDQAQLPLVDKVSIMAQVAEGLAHAHSKGIVHRDVKPENIMLLPDGNVKIMDFGIAIAPNRPTDLSQTIGIIGTPFYFSPEQVAGQRANEQSDIFAYGDIYYELLTGKHPFDKFAGDLTSLSKAIETHEPAAVGRLVAGCPEELENLVHRTLAKEPALRYRTFDEVRLDNEAILVDLQHERVASILQDIPPLMESGDLPQALARANEAYELEPGNREVRRLRDDVTRRMQKQEAQGQISKLADEAEKRIAERSYAEAAQRLESAIRLDSTNRAIRQRLSEVQSLLDRSMQSNRLVSEARLKRQSGQIQEAVDLLLDALRIEPDHPEAGRLCARFIEDQGNQQRDQRWREAARAASEHCAAHRFEEALAALAVVEVEQSANPDFTALRARIQREQHAGKFNKAVAAIGAAMQAGVVEDVARMADQLAANFPDNPGVDAVLPGLRDWLSAQSRSREVDAALQEATRLRDAGDPQAALNAVAQARQKLGEQPALQDFGRDLESRINRERAQASLEEQRRLVGGVLATAATFEARGEILRALGVVEQALQRFPQHPDLAPLAARLRRLQAIDKYRGAVRQEIDQGGLAKAGELLRQAAAELPGESAFDDLAKEVDAGLFNKGLIDVAGKVRAHLAGNAVAEAEALIVANRGVYERDPRWAALAAEVARRKECDAVAGGIRERLESGIRSACGGAAQAPFPYPLGALWDLFDQAAAQLGEARGKYPGKVPWDTLQKDIQARQAQLEDEIAENARRCRVSSALDAGAAEIAAARARHPGDPFWNTLATALDAASEARASAIEQAIGDATALRAQGDPGRAIALLEPWSNDEPADSAVAQLLARCREDFRAKTRQDLMTAVAQLRSAGRFQDAIARIDNAVTKRAVANDAELAALRAALEADLQQLKKRRERQMLIAAAVIVFALLGGFVLYKLFSRAPKLAVIIHTTPPGAAILVGQESCVTPNCQLRLRPGVYQIEAHLDGFQPSTTLLNLTEASAQNPVEISLQSNAPAVKSGARKNPPPQPSPVATVPNTRNAPVPTTAAQPAAIPPPEPLRPPAMPASSSANPPANAAATTPPATTGPAKTPATTPPPAPLPPAVTHAPEISASDVQTAVDANARGISLYQDKHYDEAIAAFKEAISKRPDFAKAYFNRGAAYFALGQFENAVPDYERALALDPQLQGAASQKQMAQAILKVLATGAYRPGKDGVTKPALISFTRPKYPATAYHDGKPGSVQLIFVVDTNGRTRDWQVLRSLGPDLDKRAMEAVSIARFQPGQKDGKPVPVEATMDVQFDPP